MLTRALIAACRFALFALFALVAAAPAGAQDLSRHFRDVDGTFVLLGGQTGAFTRWNAARADRRFAPCSTFKIPNTAILLETGAAADPEFVVKYDPALRASREAWRQDHTLRSAYRESVLWYYQALARTAGLPAVARLVKQFGYGNADTSGGVAGDRPFWVDGSLRISANEQVAFLQRLHENRLGLSERTSRLTKAIMVAEQTPHGTLRAKTGACHPAGDAQVTLWYVGYVEKPSGVWYFALELGDRAYDPLMAQRVPKARAILADLGVLPAPGGSR
jgi:beta-lactamase class D/beta-lactamase class D OXA-10